MTRITLSSELQRDGFSRTEVAQLVRGGQLVRLRRGAYCEPYVNDIDAVAAHRALLAATVRQVSPQAVVSHQSAAVLHELPIWNDDLGRVQLTRDRAGGARRTPNLQVHGLPLDPSEVMSVGVFRVTGVARTVLDLACALPMARSVAAGDAALARGLSRDELADVLRRARGRHGAPAARRALAFLDERSESPGESYSRVVFQRYRLPQPEPQYVVQSSSGVVVGRCDFGWPELGTLGEFDGKVKYSHLLRPGQRPEDAVFAEKRREDALRDLGWQVVRWIWADLDEPGPLLARLERAFDRGRRMV